MQQLGPSKWAEAYIGIPYVPQGFDKKGCHCWGLVWKVFKEQKQIELNKYLEMTGEDLRKAARAFVADKVMDPWVDVIGPTRDFDLVLMTAYNRNEGKLRRIHGHIAIVCGPEYVLHVSEDFPASIMHFTHPQVKTRMLGAYRHKDLVYD